MKTNRIKGVVAQSAFALLAAQLVSVPAYAVANGVLDYGMHPAAGYLVYNRAMPTSCGNYVNKCSGSLIDISNLGDYFPSSYTRRIYVTAAHCLADQDGVYIADPNIFLPGNANPPIPNPNYGLSIDPYGVQTNIYVAFEQTPNWLNCQATGRTLSVDGSRSIPIDGYEFFNSNVFYLVQKAYYPADIAKNVGTVGSKTGQMVNDFAIFVLAQPVPESVVPTASLVKINVPTAPYFLPVKDPDDIPNAQVTSTGYGRAFSGLDGNGKPIYSGPTQKMTILSPVNSMQNDGIHTQMNIQQDQGSLCLWDSGSGAVVDNIVGGVTYTNILLGVTSGGDANCRAINTYARTDTSIFFNWLLKSVKPFLAP